MIYVHLDPALIQKKTINNNMKHKTLFTICYISGLVKKSTVCVFYCHQI